MMTLDHLAELLDQDCIDLLKIDVGGMELAALRGASRLLEEGRIGAIVLEADEHDIRYGTSNSDLVVFPASKNYRLNTAASVHKGDANNCQVYPMEQDKTSY